MMQAYILLGGLGTRLRPLTNIVPKPLLPLAGKPFLWYQLKLLSLHNVKDVVLGLGYAAQKFEKELESIKMQGLGDLKIKVVVEKEPLGTGGGIALASPYLTQPTFILNGDVLTDLNLSAMAEFHKKTRAAVTIAVTFVPHPKRYGLVFFGKDCQIREFKEKPGEVPGKGWINAGVYIFEPGITLKIPKNKPYSLERGLFPSLLKEKETLFAYPHSGYWLDIGTLHAYMQAKADIKDGRFAFQPVSGV
ncbi:MAG: NDP-sugar synthase [Candidatus Omnitrophota bacterium]